MAGYNVAVVGVTGMVGQTFIEVLQERKFPIKGWKLLASSRSAGQKIAIGGKDYTVEEARPESFAGIDFAFFSAGGEISRQLAPEAVEKGAIVIDNSSAFRLEPEVPLIVPEVNAEAALRHKGLLANPNCSTTQMVVALQPLQLAAGLKRVVAATYQSVSGAGREAVDELTAQSLAVLKDQEVVKERIPYQGATRHYQIAFNMVPQIDVFDEDDYTKEELKMILETRKIMGLPGLPITVTTVRVPVFNGHSEAINAELEKPLSPGEARQVLAGAPGIIVQDDPAELLYPMPVDTVGRDEVFIGRIRVDRSVPHGLNMWVVSDNIRKGAATNSIQIAELLI
ncbi:MAG: aspartate-semialdehyde dehydrogenase [Firmicutes bacterium]|nr:aspartate-semialdehyde dehydrogenase [Bacillota bacterium]